MSHVDTADQRSLRPAGLSPEVVAKYNAAKAHLARRDLIRSIRSGLENLVDGCEREHEARRLSAVGGGQFMSQRHADTLTLRENVEALLRELGHD
jgi:hypothetical protein